MAAAWMAAAMTAVLQGTTWVGPAEAPLKISFEDGRAHGALSCNAFRSAYDEGDATLGFGNIITTRKGCAPDKMQTERLVLKFLGQTKSFVMDGDALVLRDADGRELMRLERGG